MEMSASLVIISFILLLMGLPVAISLGLSSLLVLAYFQPVPFSIIPERLFSGSQSYVLVAVPFFILAGTLMESSGIADRLIKFCKAFLGWSKGGLGAVNVIDSFLFGGISGSSIADTAALGTILIPQMVDDGYDLGYSAAITAVTSCLSVIVPPSILMILMGATIEQSVAKLLVGGILPATLLAILMFIQNYLICKKRNYGTYIKFSFQNIWESFKTGLPALGAPLVILGGILTGWVTPTEASGIAVFYTLFVSCFILKSLNKKMMFNAVKDTVKITAQIMFVVAASKLFTFILTIDGLPQKAATAITNLTDNPWLVLLLIDGIMIIAGMMIDAVVSLLIFVPILYPITQMVGIDPIHFGVLFVVLLAVGLVTPPFGVCLYSVCGIAQIKFEELVKATVPFYLFLIIAVLLLTFLPQIILFLPNLFLK